MAIEVKTYRVSVNGITETIEASRVEFMPTTGQSLFYIENELRNIVPAAAIVIEINEEIFIKRQHKEVLDYLALDREADKFWSQFLEKYRHYDLPDEKVSEEDRALRVKFIERRKIFAELKELLIKS
ncbi:hypothetical protein [Flavobacterium mekongense]|uniref:hypothetical protein n=1 Tax=Flavobacterium mekongense TaxID=3379707 RepID=UPI003999B679